MGHYNRCASKKAKGKKKNQVKINETSTCYWIHPTINHVPTWLKPKRQRRDSKVWEKLCWILLLIFVF